MKLYLVKQEHVRCSYLCIDNKFPHGNAWVDHFQTLLIKIGLENTFFCGECVIIFSFFAFGKPHRIIKPKEPQSFMMMKDGQASAGTKKKQQRENEE